MELTIKNIHRAKTVRSKTNPELGEQPIEFRGVRHGFRHYSHTIGSGDNKQTVLDKDLTNWEVITFKYEVSLEEYWDRARTANNWTSMDPEIVGQNLIVEYEEKLVKDLIDIPADEQERYIAKFKEHFSNILSKKSNCTASYVTGPANYDTKRHDRTRNAENRALTDFSEWRRKTLKAIKKKAEAARPEEEKLQEEWNYLKNRYQSLLDFTVKEYGEGNYPSTDNFYNKLETRAREGKIWIIEQAFEYMTELNKGRKKPIITPRHKFWKLKDLAIQSKEKLQEQAVKENSVVEFKGGRIVQNYKISRIQIFFDDIPSEEVRTLLKKEFHFNFSRKEGNAWQRQMTSNTVEACRRFLKIYNNENEEEALKQILIQIVENSRTDHTPQVGDNIQYTDRNGNYYPDAIINNKTPYGGYPVLLQPNTVNLNINDWDIKHYYLNCTGTGEGVPDFSNFKFIGTSPRKFRYIGKLRTVEFTANVNLWEYKQPSYF